MKKVADILRAIGYTPKTLAADLDISASRAGRLLRGESDWRHGEIQAVHGITGIRPNMLFGMDKLGELREKYLPREVTK